MHIRSWHTCDLRHCTLGVLRGACNERPVMCCYDVGVQVHADLHPGNILVNLRPSALQPHMRVPGNQHAVHSWNDFVQINTDLCAFACYADAWAVLKRQAHEFPLLFVLHWRQGRQDSYYVQVHLDAPRGTRSLYQRFANLVGLKVLHPFPTARVCRFAFFPPCSHTILLESFAIALTLQCSQLPNVDHGRQDRGRNRHVQSVCCCWLWACSGLDSHCFTVRLI